MRHLKIQELNILRHLQHDLGKMLQIGEEHTKFLGFHYTPGRRRDTSRPNWEHGEHYISAGKNIEGAFFDILGDKWLFYIKGGSTHPYLLIKIIPDYLLEAGKRRSHVVNGEISHDRLFDRIVNDVREFYKFSPIYFDLAHENDVNIQKAKRIFVDPILKKPK